jgi:hypothetical protein
VAATTKLTSKSHRASASPPRAGRAASATVPLVALFALTLAPAAHAALPETTITQGRIQVLLPSRPAAGYFTLENRGDTALVLSGASAPDCQSLMLHRRPPRRRLSEPKSARWASGSDGANIAGPSC